MEDGGRDRRANLPRNVATLLIAVWSMVHGYCHLAFGGELSHPARGGGGKEVILESLLPLMLKHLPSRFAG